MCGVSVLQTVPVAGLLLLTVLPPGAPETSLASSGEGGRTVDGNFIAELYQEVLDQLRQEDQEAFSCVYGLEYTDGKQTLTTTNGKIANLMANLKEQVNVFVEEVGDTGDEFLKAKVGFEFPEIFVNYDFTYQEHHLVHTSERKGEVTFKIWPMAVFLHVKIPSTDRVVKNSKDGHVCKHKVSADAIKTYSEHFDVQFLDCPSKSGLNLSREKIRTIVENSGEDVTINVGYYLERLIANVVIKKSVVTCLDEDAKSIYLPFNQEKDCRQYRYTKNSQEIADTSGKSLNEQPSVKRSNSESQKKNKFKLF